MLLFFRVLVLFAKRSKYYTRTWWIEKKNDVVYICTESEHYTVYNWVCLWWMIHSREQEERNRLAWFHRYSCLWISLMMCAIVTVFIVHVLELEKIIWQVREIYGNNKKSTKKYQVGVCAIMWISLFACV